MWRRPYRKQDFTALQGWAINDVNIELWVPILVLGLVAARLWKIDRVKKPGSCTKCGYDLTGLAASACPECGQALPAAKPS